jgi:hypothetical protein
MCLLELGADDQARKTFEEVERLAAGWFRCRSDLWLARSLAENRCFTKAVERWSGRGPCTTGSRPAPADPVT